MANIDCKKAIKNQSNITPTINEDYLSLEDLIWGFSLALHKKIIEDFESKRSVYSSTNETFFNRDHLVRFINSDLKDAPSANEIFSFTYKLYGSSDLSEECLMVTLMYILKVLKTSEIKIFAGNWQIIVIAATLSSMRVCDASYDCSLKFENSINELSFDEIFELDFEFSHLMESKCEIDLPLFEKCLVILTCDWEAGSKKKWELDLEKVSKIINKSKTFGEAKEDCDSRIVKSERIYNIDLEAYDFDN